MSPLDNVPLNTRRVYVMATAPGGCEVYMPVDNDNDGEQRRMRDVLQAHLNTQPTPAPPRAA